MGGDRMGRWKEPPARQRPSLPPGEGIKVLSGHPGRGVPTGRFIPKKTGALQVFAMRLWKNSHIFEDFRQLVEGIDAGVEGLGGAEAKGAEEEGDPGTAAGLQVALGVADVNCVFDSVPLHEDADGVALGQARVAEAHPALEVVPDA